MKRTSVPMLVASTRATSLRDVAEWELLVVGFHEGVVPKLKRMCAPGPVGFLGREQRAGRPVQEHLPVALTSGVNVVDIHEVVGNRQDLDPPLQWSAELGEIARKK